MVLDIKYNFKYKIKCFLIKLSLVDINCVFLKGGEISPQDNSANNNKTLSFEHVSLPQLTIDIMYICSNTHDDDD